MINKRKLAFILAGTIVLSNATGCNIKDTAIEEDTNSTDNAQEEPKIDIDYSVVVDTKTYSVGEHAVAQVVSSETLSIPVGIFNVGVPDGYELLSVTPIEVADYGVSYTGGIMYTYVNNEEVIVNGYQDHTNNVVVYDYFGTPTRLDLTSSDVDKQESNEKILILE